MPEDLYKIVDFGKCNTCKYKDTAEADEPCNECMNHPENLYSHTPINWKET